MNTYIDVVYGKYNNINLTDILPRLEKKILSERRIRKIVYYFVSDDELLEINKKHLDHDYFTDIITFDYSTGRALDGEIYISIDRVVENNSNFAQEIVRVMSHGILHMLGYKDKSKEEKRLMRKREEEWLDFIVSRES